jgi:thiol-disulfide isomerase/thioredoxin
LVAYYRLFTPEEGEDAEVLGISYLNRVFDKLEENPAYFAPVADFLRIGFEQMGQPKALHLIQQRVATQNACSDPLLAQRLQTAIGQYEKTAPGALAPALKNLLRVTGDTLAEQVVGAGMLVFWSADCPHCLRDLPDLHLWMKNNRPQIAVTAIALDSWEVGWRAERMQFDSWTHLRDPLGWDGPTSLAYQVHATPYFVRIDAQGKIIDTYRSVAALRKALE